MKVVLTRDGIKFVEPSSCMYRAAKWRTPEGKLILIEAKSITIHARFALMQAGYEPATKTRAPRLSRRQRLY